MIIRRLPHAKADVKPNRPIDITKQLSDSFNTEIVLESEMKETSQARKA